MKQLTDFHALKTLIWVPTFIQSVWRMLPKEGKEKERERRKKEERKKRGEREKGKERERESRKEWKEWKRKYKPFSQSFLAIRWHLTRKQAEILIPFSAPKLQNKIPSSLINCY